MTTALIAVLVLSILFQCLAAYFALRLIRLAGKPYAWILISIALSLMCIRRIIPLYFILSNLSFEVDFLNEIIGLILSAFIFLGILKIKSIFIERNQTEEALKNAMSIIDATLESIHNGILVVDAKGAVLKTNKKFAELWNIPAEILASSDDNALLGYVVGQLDDPDEFMAKVSELYSKPDSESLDFVKFKDGRILERISKPMYFGRAPKGRVWSFLDITGRMRAEEEIKLKNKELLQLNVEKDKFFSIIAHDLLGPFQPLLGFSRMLAEDLPTLRHDEIQKIALSMRDAANKLFNLLENLLQWSRMQRGLTSFEPEPLFLMSKLSDSLAPNLEAITSKEIELRYVVSEDLKVYADSYMFESITRNLVSNATKFTTPGGGITITAKLKDDHWVEIAVRDTGIGMNKEMLENLFNLDANTNRKGTEGEPSNGLGLIICKEFVEKNGGKLWIKSEEGQGSTFYFTLPASV